MKFLFLGIISLFALLILVSAKFEQPETDENRDVPIPNIISSPNEIVQSPLINRGRGTKYNCIAERGWTGQKWITRDVIIQKKYISYGQTKLKDVKISGRKCKSRNEKFPVIKGVPSELTPTVSNLVR